jgi:hypothetical protein
VINNEDMKQICLELDRDIGTVVAFASDAMEGIKTEKGDAQMLKETCQRLDASMDKLMQEFCK